MYTLRRQLCLHTLVELHTYVSGVFFDHFVPHYGFQQKSDSSDIFMFYTTGVKLILDKGQKFIKRARFNTPKRPVLARKPYVWRPCPKLWFYHCVSVRDWCRYLCNIWVLTSSKYRVTSRRKSRTPCVALHSKSCFFYSNKIWVSKLVPYILFKLVTFCYARKKTNKMLTSG